MSPHHNDTYNDTGDYPNSRRRSYQPSPESQQRLAELPVSMVLYRICLFDLLTRDIS